MIRVVNVKTYKQNAEEIFFKIDRTSPLGNPFHMEDETQRARVCEYYKVWFNDKVKKQDDTNFLNYLEFIYNKAKNNNIALGCWCSPKQCHGEVIKEYLEEKLNETTI